MLTEVDLVDGPAAPEIYNSPPAPEGWKDDDVQRVKRPDVGPDGGKVKRSDKRTEGNPWEPYGNPWSLDDEETRKHEPHKGGILGAHGTMIRGAKDEGSCGKWEGGQAGIHAIEIE